MTAENWKTKDYANAISQGNPDIELAQYIKNELKGCPISVISIKLTGSKDIINDKVLANAVEDFAPLNNLVNLERAKQIDESLDGMFTPKFLKKRYIYQAIFLLMNSGFTIEDVLGCIKALTDGQRLNLEKNGLMEKNPEASLVQELSSHIMTSTKQVEAA